MAPKIQKQFEGHGAKPQKSSKPSKHTSYASNGRLVTAPRRYWTSSDEPSRKRPRKSLNSVHNEIQALSSGYKDNPKFAILLKSSDKLLMDSHKPKSTPKSNQSLSQIKQNQQKTRPSQVLEHPKKLPLPKNTSPSTVSPLPVDPKTSNAKITGTISESSKDNGNSPLPDLHNENGAPNTSTKKNKPKSSDQNQNVPPVIEMNKNLHAMEQNSNFPQDNVNINSGLQIPAWESNILVPENVLLDITTRLRNVEEQNLEILSIVRTLKEDSKVVKSNSLFAPPQGYPLKTIEEFNSFEDDDNKVNALYSKLRKYGGTKLREALSFAFKSSMTDEVATKFTWYGDSGDTKNFGETKMASLLYQVVNKCKQFKGPENFTEFKSEMTEVLRAAKQRYRNSGKKENRTPKNKSKERVRPKEHNFEDSEENEDGEDPTTDRTQDSEEDETDGSYEGDDDEGDDEGGDYLTDGSYEGDHDRLQNLVEKGEID
ncbi:zinc-regulated protein 8-like [Leptopilina heterotoma]|uniref:zinc-regulated protein 8-like n=1 Tax=Leptopilina heterotoma TaxID=63436 RepID=UPI001CA937BE|nr:zinc-regulated protein 8-like [Leptopilina heterotoma]XP_043465704.1 zinc-regulated protein 8-like [Leptopilina heterotoma]